MGNHESMRSYMDEQIRIIQNPDYKREIAKKIGHDPSDEEVVNEYIKSGKAKIFSQQHKH